MMDELTADGVLNPKAPFEHEVQWVFWNCGITKAAAPATAPP